MEREVPVDGVEVTAQCTGNRSFVGGVDEALAPNADE